MFRPLLPAALVALSLGMSTHAFALFGQADVTEATSAVMGAASAAAQVSHLRQVPSVGVLDLQSAAATPTSDLGSDIRTLEIYADNHASKITQLRHALAANPVTRRALAEHGVNIGRVIGVVIGGSGSLRVFLD